MTQSELAELLEILRELEGLGWPVHVNEGKRYATVMLDDRRSDSGAYSLALSLYNRTSWTLAAVLIPDEAAEDLIVGYLERQVDDRDLWGDYLAALYEARWQRGETEETRRATLLEVARAVLAVAQGGEDA